MKSYELSESKRTSQIIKPSQDLVAPVLEEKVAEALYNMKNKKNCSPNNIPVEVWKCLGQVEVNILTQLFTFSMRIEQFPDAWRKSTLVPVLKRKGDIQDFGNHVGIKLMSHMMKIWKKLLIRYYKQK